MKQHFTELLRFSHVLNRRHMILGAGLWLSDWVLAWGLIAAYDAWIDPIRESTAAWLLLGICILYLVSLLPILRWYKRNCRLDLNRVARRIEQAFPELNDLLVTAAHLESRNLAAPNPLEVHVFESAAQQLESIDWRAGATRLHERLPVVSATLFAGLLLALLSLQLVPLRKALYHIEDGFGANPSGITFSAVPEELPAPSDLNVELQVNRWQKQALIEWADAAGTHSEPVVIDAAGRGVFTFYGVTESIRFRVETPALRSAWMGVEAYEPARIEKLETIVSPPAYTGLPENAYNDLRDIEVPEGSKVSFAVKAGAARTVELVTVDGSTALETSGPGSFTTRFVPTRTTPYSFHLSDARNRVSKTAGRNLTLLPDKPPTVEILKPQRDSVLSPDAVFPVELFAADDYGLARGRIHLALSGTDATPLAIPFDQVIERDESGRPLPLREATLASLIDLARLEAGDGDLLAIHIEVEDSREPVPNLTRTDLLFIEIRTPVEPVEMDGMPMEQTPIDFRELIEEQKRLLRETHRIEVASASTREALVQEIPAGLGGLAVEIRRIFNEVQAAIVSAGRDDLSDLFLRALAENSRAIEAFATGQPAESVSPQSTSLSALLKLENAFRQNTRSKKPSKGSSGEGESGEPDEEKTQEPAQGESVGQALKAAMQQLEQLIKQQNALVSEFDRAAQSSWSLEQAGASAQAQEQLGQETNELRLELNSLEGSGAARQSLAEARQHMQSAAANAADTDAGGALRDGYRAREALRFAASELAAMLDEAASQELAGAARAASQLAKEQAAAGAASAAAADPAEAELAEMEQTQRELKERLDSLLEQMQARAQQAAGSSPQLSEALQQAARNAGQRGTSGSMERAANALLYGQPGMAAPIQAAAANELSQLADELQAARARMLSDPARRALALNRELEAALEELASHARQPESAPQERLQEIAREWNARFMELQQLTGDPRFGNLAGRIASGATGQWDGQLGETRTLLQQGSGLLREFLFEEASQSGLHMNREAAPPPDQYRKMVEEYFRRLAREPGQQ